MASVHGEKGEKMRLIDADALIQDLKDHNIPFNADINEAIIVAPTVDAEPVKHGRWDTKYLSEDEDWSGIEHTIGRCSVCEGKVDIAGKRIPYLYCPFCGAKMDEVEDG